jgi:hypothetical protein
MEKLGIALHCSAPKDVAEEAAFAYKDIDAVMAASADLIRPMTRLTPLRGGVNQAILDGQSHRGTGHLSLHTPGAGTAADRYEIDLSGGISKVEVTTR